MLVEFSLKNYTCFKEEVKLSLIASNYDKKTRKDDNIIYLEKFDLKLLKSAVVYGANASGKTKLIEGFVFMRRFILDSFKESQIDEKVDVKPFLLNTETEKEPSSFEIIFIHENDVYRYGFEVDKQVVHAEWLYQKSNTKEIEVFYRDFQEFEINETLFDVGDLVKRKRIRSNALLLSVAASFNDEFAEKIFHGLSKINSISGINAERYERFTINRMQEDENGKKAVLEFLKNAGLGIEDLKENTLDYDNLPKEMPKEMKDLLIKHEISFSSISTYRKKYNANNLFDGVVELSMDEDESEGTKKYFALSGLILEILKLGEVLIVDELANKLHPNLTCKLIEIFNSKARNPNNAQLIFNTHDTNLLSSGLFRRDQIWFTEKDRYGASSLYSLADFKTNKVRKTDNFEKNYINGRYGGIPYLGNFDELLTL